MKLFQKNHGAVTVFLVIILVPVILVTSIFVDVCRVELAQSVVNSAGDLALNTLLSQYDSDLNEFYGMIASCQSMEDFYDVAGEFYETALQSKGLEDKSGAVAQKIKEILEGKQETVDLLQIGWEGDKAYTFEEVPNGNLANPALVKKEIVEFMKYRSPINGAADLLEKLKKSKKSLEDSEKDSDLIEKKEDYYEAEKDVVEAALNAYKELKNYENMNMDESYVKELKQFVASLESSYKELDGKVIRDLFNTEGLGAFAAQNINVNPVVTQTYSDSQKASAKDIETCMKNYAKTVHDFVNARKSLDNALNVLPAYSKSTVYDIQYWKTCSEILNQNGIYGKYAAQANSLCYQYGILKNAVDHMAEGADAENITVGNYTNAASTGTKTVKEHFSALEQQYKGFLNKELKSSDEYFIVGNRLRDISNANFGAINGDSTSQRISEISTRLKGYKSKIESAEEYLNKAEDKVKKLKKYCQNYQTAKNNWSASANGSDTELAENDRKEIQNLSQEKEIMKNITEERVNELLNRIGNIKGLFAQMKKALDSCKYNGTSVMEIENLSDFKNKSGIDGNRITYVKADLENYVKEHSSKVTMESVEISINNSNNPAMKDVKTPGLYAWLMKYFKDYESKEAECEENKEKYEEYKEVQDKKNEETDTKGNSSNNKEINGQAALPSGIYADLGEQQTQSSIAKVAEFTRNLCNDFAGTLSNLGVKIRDDLYSVDYIMSMFSYDTYENEGKYELCSDSDKNSMTPVNCPGRYSSVSGKWNSDKVTDTYNKSLTNHMINAANNWSYQNEVEYILYGGSNLQNKAAAYSQIFLLRYALNLPAEFKSHWSGTPLDGIAAAISAATYGIIPEALVKLAIILALTIMETGCDLLYLQAGIPVLLVKGEGDLFIDLSGKAIEEKIKENISEASKGSSAKSKSGITFQYSDYMKLFLFLKLFNENKSYKVYARTADVIQVNMQHNVVKKEYKLEDAVVYYKLKSNVRVQPLMLDLPLMRSEAANQVDTIKELDWCKIKYEAVRGY